MVMLDQNLVPRARPISLSELCGMRWAGRVAASLDDTGRVCRIKCQPAELREICEWLMCEGFAIATLVVEEGAAWSLSYVFYKDPDAPWVYVDLQLEAGTRSVPSISGLAHGPSADWHEREVEDLFGLSFEGHPRLGDFVLHEDWPEGTNPMRRHFHAGRPLAARASEPRWQPPTVVVAPGAFAMPIGPVFSDFAESAHFLLETVGEDVIHTIPRFFYKYRGVEKIAEGQPIDRVLLLAERFSGIAAFAHGLAFCQAVEAICGIEVPERERALRTVFAELERLRHHAAAVTLICNSTALAVATSQAALIEEDLLRLSCEMARHRYLFGLIKPGGLACDLSDEQCRDLAAAVGGIARASARSPSDAALFEQLSRSARGSRYHHHEAAISYGLVGPIARASGVARDIRKVFPYAAYAAGDFTIPVEPKAMAMLGCGFFFAKRSNRPPSSAKSSPQLPGGQVFVDYPGWRAGTALTAVEAPSALLSTG